MSPLVIKTLHVLAAFGLFLSFGAIFMAANRNKSAMIVHGVSLLFLILFGLHLLMAQGLVKSGGWWHAKIVLALILGVAPVFVRKQWLSPLAASGLCLLIGGGATYLALAKPF